VIIYRQIALEKALMADKSAWWEKLGLPDWESMEQASLRWILKRPDHIYDTDELKDHLARHFRLTNEQITATTYKGKPVWPNYVDWQSANWTTKKYHKRVHSKRYHLTDGGLQRARMISFREEAD
jgi:hypothetical protein